MSKLKVKENIIVEKHFLPQESISDIHKFYGLFICPTRQDAQGVSMCEAIASGLIPITIKNTAIPEFLPKEIPTCRNISEMLQFTRDIINDPVKFLRLSKIVSEFIKTKCGYNATILKELQIFQYSNASEPEKVNEG